MIQTWEKEGAGSRRASLRTSLLIAGIAVVLFLLYTQGRWCRPGRSTWAQWGPRSPQCSSLLMLFAVEARPEPKPRDAKGADPNDCLIRFLRRSFFDYDRATLHDPADIVDNHVDIGQRVSLHGHNVGEIAGRNGAELPILA